MEASRRDRGALVRETVKVAQALAQPDRRKEFAGDPRGTLQRAGIDVGVFPQAAVDALVELTPEELDVFLRVNQRLAGAGLDMPEDGGKNVAFF